MSDGLPGLFMLPWLTPDLGMLIRQRLGAPNVSFDRIGTGFVSCPWLVCVTEMAEVCFLFPGSEP